MQRGVALGRFKTAMAKKHIVRLCTKSLKCQVPPIKLWILLICLDNFIRYASEENITGFCNSSQLKVADFSYNFLVGSIPKCLENLQRYFSDSLVNWHSALRPYLENMYSVKQFKLSRELPAEQGHQAAAFDAMRYV